MKKMMLGLLMASCASNEYVDGALKLRWTLPAGVKLKSENTEGPLTIARFSGGVEVRSMVAQPLATTGDLDKLKAAVTTASQMELEGAVRTGRSGTIPNGPTAMWEMEQIGSDRSLLYYIPGGDRYVLISLVAPAATFDHKSDKLQLSLSTLKLH